MVLATSVFSSDLKLAPSAYPKVARGEVVDNYHGTRVADPYRWMEEVDSAATKAYIEAQNALARPQLEGLPGFGPLRARITELNSYERFGLPQRAAQQYFFLHRDGKQDQSALHVAATPGELGRVLIDPTSLSRDATVALDDYVPSPDGKLLAYSLSDAGSDWKTWHVRDVATGQDRADVLRETKFTTVSWLKDGSGFYYSAYPKADDHKQTVIRLHKLGEAQSQDAEIYAVRDHATRNPYGEISDDGRYLVITLDEGTLSNGVVAMALDGSGQVTPVLTRYDGVHSYLGSRQGRDTELLFRTTSGAPNARIIAVDLGLPEGQRERVVVPESKEVLESARLINGRVLAAYLADAHSKLRLFDAASGKLQSEVALPGLGTVSALSGEPDDTEAYFSYTDFATPGRVYKLPMVSGTPELLHAPKFAADVSGYVTEQVFYRSKDGTRVPMFIVHRRDFKRDGRAPAMLYGYGGFDISMTPAFSGAVVAWLEMGGIYVVPNLRGGGEYGAAWHIAGTRAQKQNVFDDFIAAAETLQRDGWAARKRIVIRGGSNGGLLVAAVITQRPDLFGAALPDVGVLDMLRYHLASANARQWSDDYGLSENAADFRSQYAYSPVHNAPRRCYPPTLITTAAQDNRVVPWHSFKFAAVLQRAQRCANPVLLRVETRAGHGAGKPLWMQMEHTAQQWAFAASALQMKVPPSWSAKP
jgi:prolyl oligopeptidase